MIPLPLTQFEKRLGVGPWHIYLFLRALQAQTSNTHITINLIDIKSVFSKQLNTNNANVYRWLRRLKAARLIHPVNTPIRRRKKDRGYGDFTVTYLEINQTKQLVEVPEDVVDSLQNLTKYKVKLTPASSNPQPKRPLYTIYNTWETSSRCGSSTISAGSLRRSLGPGPWSLYQYLVGLRLKSTCLVTRAIYIRVSHVVEKSKLRRKIVNLNQRSVYRWLKTLKDAKLIQECTPPEELTSKYKPIRNHVYGWFQVFGRRTDDGIWLVRPETYEWVQNKPLHGGSRAGAFGREEELDGSDALDIVLPPPQPYLH